MTCLYCTEKKETFARSVPLRAEEYSHDFPINDIIENFTILFTGLYICKDCDSVWQIQSKGTGDPRSTYPEYSEQTAVKLNERLKNIVMYPTLQAIIDLEKYDLPYNFQAEALDAIKLKEAAALKNLYLSQNKALSYSVKNWLENWYESNFPTEFQKFKEIGFHLGAQEVISISHDEEVYGIEFISLNDYVIWLKLENDEKTKILSRNLTTGKLNWEFIVEPPFQNGMDIPFLFYQSGYLCSLHGVQIGSKYYDKLNRPDKLVIRNLDGQVLFESILAWKCYEVISTEERDYSENRIVQNFQFAIINDILYLPFKNDIIVYDLIKMEALSNIKMPSGQTFMGQISVSETNQFFVRTLRGYAIYDSSWNLELNYQSPYHPIFVDSQLNLYYYYAKVENKLNKTKIEFVDKKDSGFSLIREFSSTPVLIPTGVYMPFSSEISYFLNADLSVKKEIPYSTLNVLGPHSHGDTTIPTLLTEDRLSIYDHFRSFVMFDFDGNVILEKNIEYMVKKLMTFDGKHIVLLEESNDGYGVSNNYLVTVFHPEGRVISTHKLRSISGWSISFEGYMIFEYRKKILKIDVFENTRQN
jgi:hypothetical protein